MSAVMRSFHTIFSSLFVLTAPLLAQSGTPQLNTVAVKAFATTVQPILTNRCASCHSKPTAPDGFRLAELPPGINDPETAIANSQIVASQIDFTDPSNSRLLSFALLPHGKLKEAPLVNSKNVAYQQLELWVHWATAAEGTPKLTAIPVKAPTVFGPDVKPNAPVVRTEFATHQPGLFSTKPDATVDPFDPAEFNQAMHPNRR